MRIYCIITYCLWTEGVCPDYREKMEKQERERMGHEQGKDKSNQKDNSKGNKGK